MRFEVRDGDDGGNPPCVARRQGDQLRKVPLRGRLSVVTGKILD